MAFFNFRGNTYCWFRKILRYRKTCCCAVSCKWISARKNKRLITFSSYFSSSRCALCDRACRLAAHTGTENGHCSFQPRSFSLSFDSPLWPPFQSHSQPFHIVQNSHKHRAQQLSPHIHPTECAVFKKWIYPIKSQWSWSTQLPLFYIYKTSCAKHFHPGLLGRIMHCCLYTINLWVQHWSNQDQNTDYNKTLVYSKNAVNKDVLCL